MATNEPVTVYAVESGEYSDHRIDAIFATRELAERFIKREQPYLGYTDYEIVERVVLAALPRARMLYRVNHDGEPYSYRSNGVEQDYFPGASYSSAEKALKAERDRRAKKAAEEAGL